MDRETASEKDFGKLSVSPSGAGEFQTEKQDALEVYPNICTLIRVKNGKDYVFDHWETTGDVTLDSPDSQTTVILPSERCSIRAVFRQRERQ